MLNTAENLLQSFYSAANFVRTQESYKSAFAYRGTPARVKRDTTRPLRRRLAYHSFIIRASEGRIAELEKIEKWRGADPRIREKIDHLKSVIRRHEGRILALTA